MAELFPCEPARDLGSLAFAVVDLETSGGHPKAGWDRQGRFRPGAEITEVGVVQMAGRIRQGRFQSLCAIEGPLPTSIQRITGITPGMLEEAPYWERVALRLMEVLEGRIWVAHHAAFDGAFLQAYLPEGLWRRHRLLCTLKLSKVLVPEAEKRGLGALVELLGLQNARPHRALEDAEATSLLLQVLLDRAEALGWDEAQLMEVGGLPWS